MDKMEQMTQRIVRSVCASMRVEGFDVSEHTQSDCVEIISGKKSAAEIVKARLAEYQRK